MKRVIVASKNPVKVNAFSMGFAQLFPDEKFEFISYDAKSEVADQPMSDEETLRGAMNRVENSKAQSADFWAAIEGGIQDTEHGMETFAWVVIESKSGKMGKARSAMFVLPERIRSLVRDGMELGDADDIVFGTQNSKQKSGTVGALTNDVVDRTTYYIQPVILALIPFKNEKLY